ncbi:hypothetical protein RJ639_038754 [Escallonia herrerae]|uniref:Expansin-like EG45 domain-containing protein n=1 Tax=Escallonia herrerae TaxID=1293975 RepID=A0AA89B6B7_9ASTE|nr:hypothetical protein RJ639_038754 [Escallonia herrerae]
MAKPQFVTAWAMSMAILCVALGYEGKNGHVHGHGQDYAHSTFYGDINGGETMQGACAYENLFEQGYGLATTTLSTALFINGATCGACF